MPKQLKFSRSGSLLSRVDGGLSVGLKRKGTGHEDQREQCNSVVCKGEDGVTPAKNWILNDTGQI